MSIMSLFIHSALANTTDEFVRTTIENKLKLGEVEKVDLVDRKDKNDRAYKMVYVHMKSWNLTPEVENLQNEIEMKGKTTVYLNKKSYWVLSKNTYTAPATNPKLVRQDAVRPMDVDDTPTMPPRLERTITSIATPPRLERCMTTVSGAPARPRLQRENVEPRPCWNTPMQSPFCPPPPQLMRCERPCLYRDESSDYEDFSPSRNLTQAFNLVDDEYVSQLEQENAWLHSVVAGLENEIANTSSK